MPGRTTSSIGGPWEFAEWAGEIGLMGDKLSEGLVKRLDTSPGLVGVSFKLLPTEVTSTVQLHYFYLLFFPKVCNLFPLLILNTSLLLKIEFYLSRIWQKGSDDYRISLITPRPLPRPQSYTARPRIDRATQR